jgi:TATA-binding protein-associated factor
MPGEVDPKERLARQRKLLQRKLGLDMGAAIGMDTMELFNDEDLDTQYTCTPSGPKAQGQGERGSEPCSSSGNHVVSQSHYRDFQHSSFTLLLYVELQ